MKEDDKSTGKRTVHKHAEKAFLGLFTTLEIKLTDLSHFWKVRWTSIWKCYMQPFVAMALEKHTNIYVCASSTASTMHCGRVQRVSPASVGVLKSFLYKEIIITTQDVLPCLKNSVTMQIIQLFTLLIYQLLKLKQGIWLIKRLKNNKTYLFGFNSRMAAVSTIVVAERSVVDGVTVIITHERLVKKR